MKHVKRSFVLLMLLTIIIGSRTSAQQLLDFDVRARQERAMKVMQDNEYTYTGSELGNFLCNPLQLNGKSLEYSEFNIQSKGELTVIKGTAITGKTTQVPFYVYLRRNGIKVLIFGKANPYQEQIKIDISEILRYAEPGDRLVIEAVKREDGPVKRILKIPGGC